jgi:SRSO17 transposase
MDERGLTRVRTQLEDFAAEVFAGLPRSDQRATGLRYLRGLMLDGQRKSMEPMAERLGTSYQQVQQFVTSSTWDVTGVRRRAATIAVEVIAPAVWVVDDTGFPKNGKASPCVARQYSGTLGKVANCQIAVSVHAASTAASAMLGARLFVPQSWDETCVPEPDGTVVNEHAHRLRDAATTTDKDGTKKPHVRKTLPRQEQIADIVHRRVDAKIPDGQRYRPKWVIALELLDELAGWGLAPPVLLADAGYGQIGEFRQGLSERGIRYVVAVNPTTTVQPGHAVPATVPRSRNGRRPKPTYPDPAVSVKDLAIAHVRDHPDAAQLVTWRSRLPDRIDPDKPVADLAGHFFAVRVRPAGQAIPRDDDGVLPERWLLIAWPPGASEPSDYWLSDLPDHTPLTELVLLAKARWRIEHDYRELKTGLGLDHFEGRSWIGWHRHVTLTAAAQLFLTRLRLTNPKAAGQT